jgi:SAM-dependent methyltransferase
MNKISYTDFNWLAFSINNAAFRSTIKLIKGCVIDLGCGTSQYKNDILKISEDYIGVDWKNSLHDQSNVDVFADLCKTLPFDDHVSDTVTSFQVLEHIPEPAFFLSECFRILKPEGYLILTVPFMWHVHEQPHDYFRYTRYGLKYLLEKTGFKNIEVIENTGFWQMWVLKFNYQTNNMAIGQLKYLFMPFWFILQLIGPILDKINFNPHETASYLAIARK